MVEYYDGEGLPTTRDKAESIRENPGDQARPYEPPRGVSGRPDFSAPDPYLQPSVLPAEEGPKRIYPGDPGYVEQDEDTSGEARVNILPGFGSEMGPPFNPGPPAAQQGTLVDQVQASQFTPQNLQGNIIGEVAQQSGVQKDPAPSLIPGTEVPFSPYTIQEGDLSSPYSTVAPMTPNVVQASTTGLELPIPERTAAATYQSFVEEGTPEFAAAQGQPSTQSLIGDVVGAVSQEAIVQAQTGELDERATVQFQIGELFKSFEEGKPTPAWAAPAVRNVGAMMAQRGLGSSSMAAAAITQSLMESGIPIAAADANKYAAIQIQNLNNKQQAALQNAVTYAAMDKANLDVRTQAAVNNARTFLQMDTQNLTNEQQLKTIDLQSQYQKLFTDQAQENASRQFNAKSQLQVDQFFSELETQVQNANSSRTAAMNQFNTDQTNASDRYYAKVNDARERFNVTNEAQISQANTAWRRQINTQNTSQQNEVNRINALNLLGTTQANLDKLWQRYRDEASWMVQITENAAQRAHSVAILAQQQDFDAEQYEKVQEDQFYTSLGNTVIKGVFGVLGAK